jgi:PTS system glucose-specific IIA component
MIKKWLGSRERKSEEILYSPLSGRVVPIEEVPDPTFSVKMAGRGIAIDPSEGRVGSPVDGELVHLSHTRHAMWIRAESGLDILIHIGLDTVYMNGEGFRPYVKSGDKVVKGQPLIDFSLELVREKAASAITPMMLITPGQIEHIELELSSRAEMGLTPLMKVKVKS